MREVTLTTNCIDATKESAQAAVNAGHSIMVLPGGIHEMLVTEHGREKLWLKNHKGFVRLALQNGLPLIPMYAFGASDLYHTHSFLDGLRMWIGSNLRVALPIFSGQHGTLCPLPVQVTIAVGAPIPVERQENPSQEALDAVHARYVEALRALFEKHKAEVGMADRELEVL